MPVNEGFIADMTTTECMPKNINSDKQNDTSSAKQMSV